MYKFSILYAFFLKTYQYTHMHTDAKFICKIDGSRNVILYLEEHRVFCKCMNILTVTDAWEILLELLEENTNKRKKKLYNNDKNHCKLMSLEKRQLNSLKDKTQTSSMTSNIQLEPYHQLAK